jgi:hypothetical protein
MGFSSFSSIEKENQVNQKENSCWLEILTAITA